MLRVKHGRCFTQMKRAPFRDKINGGTFIKISTTLEVADQSAS